MLNDGDLERERRIGGDLDRFLCIGGGERETLRIERDLDLKIK